NSKYPDPQTAIMSENDALGKPWSVAMVRILSDAFGSTHNLAKNAMQKGDLGVYLLEVSKGAELAADVKMGLIGEVLRSGNIAFFKKLLDECQYSSLEGKEKQKVDAILAVKALLSNSDAVIDFVQSRLNF